MKTFIFKQLISNIYKTYFSINLALQEFRLNKNDRCLILAPHADAETLGCGGLFMQNPSQFDIYCLTNGFKDIEGALSYEEKIALRKKEFFEVMETAGVNYYHFFDDIDDKRLIMRYDRFRTISISDYDYIFIPNILDRHRDYKSVAILLNELLKNRPYKKNVRIVMYEVWSTLAMPNSYVNIENTIDKKMELIKMYRSQMATHDYLDTIKDLNHYRGVGTKGKFAEAYCLLDINDFKKICKVYSV